ncbi:MAG: response regulator [Desulfobacteraceae bacterium]|nr:response regulator [Desulfobacteraceae bacterium]
MRSNLSLNIIGVVFLISLFTFPPFAYVSITNIKENLEKVYIEKAITIARSLDANIRSREMLKDQSRLFAIIQKIIWLEPDIIEIDINVPNSETLVTLISSRPENNGKKADLDNVVSFEKDLLLNKTFTTGKKEYLSVISPIHIAKTQVGTYQIILTLENINDHIRSTVQISVICFLTIICIYGLCLFWYLRSTIIKPIKEINKGIKTIAQGNWDYKIKLSSQDEIGILSKAYNEMSDDLKESHDKFERQSAELLQSNVALIQEIHDRKMMEQELLKVKNLESLGTLAGGIAHDFNNLLTGILGNISLVKINMDSQDPKLESLNDAEKASLMAKELTHQLLTFSKGGVPFKETTYLGKLLTDSAKIVLVGSKVKCHFLIQEDLLPVEVDSGQISQVVNNLIINADQAMPSGGNIFLSAENITINSNHPGNLTAGKWVKIMVQDQGYGISHENLSRIFDPYFTTKDKGSGLGLATSYSIIKMHNGEILVESELGFGTTFTIFLPYSQKQLRAKSDVGEHLISGAGKILVMDDEEFMQKFTAKALAFIGYDSDLAKDGEEAIRLYKNGLKSERPYDVVILDLTIPGGMGGKETIRELLKIDPTAKAVVTSGYSSDNVLSNFKEYGFKNVVKKPFRIQELSTILQEVISQG